MPTPCCLRGYDDNQSCHLLNDDSQGLARTVDTPPMCCTRPCVSAACFQSVTGCADILAQLCPESLQLSVWTVAPPCWCHPKNTFLKNSDQKAIQMDAVFFILRGFSHVIYRITMGNLPILNAWLCTLRPSLNHVHIWLLLLCARSGSQPANLQNLGRRPSMQSAQSDSNLGKGMLGHQWH